MFLVLLLSFVLAAAGDDHAKCYDEADIMTAFTIDGVDLMDSVDESETTWQKSSVADCDEGNVCFQYDVDATADARESESAVETAPAVMKFTSQGCMPESTTDTEELRQAICAIWLQGLETSLEADPETAGKFINLATDCGEVVACGESCVSKEHSGATGLHAQLSLAVLTALSYLLF